MRIFCSLDIIARRYNLSDDYYFHMSRQTVAPSELLAAMAGGDQRAMDTLYRDWSRKVRLFARSQLARCGLDADAIADEITVDVFHDVWRAPLSYDGRVSFATWLLTITRNKAITQIRRHARRTGLHDSLGDEDDHMAPAPSLEAVQEAAQRSAAVMNCLRRLKNPLQRESLTLWALEDLSVLDIARIQDAPEGTVKTRLFHGRLNLRQCLERWFVQEGGRNG